MDIFVTQWKIGVVRACFWLTEAEATDAVQNQVMQWFFE
jgi:hypothetical protein